MQQIQYIKTNQLHESSMNPRKEFDHESIEQLAESIKQVGILQPIIARLNTKTVQIKKIPIYEVICGSRRLSAADMADLKEVPVIVRELSDEEAFDLMITENLQRKDVSPLEEASAFQSLINKGKYDVYSLSDRFGKSVTYIRQRLQLNELIIEFRNLLNKEVITVSHAIEISKLDAVYQNELYDDDFSMGEYWNCPTVKQLKRSIENKFTLKLNEAPFDLEDPTLKPSIGACTDCPKNTASTASLFPDDPDSGKCLDILCFKQKREIHFERELNRIQEEEPDVIIGAPTYVYGEDEKRVKDLKSKGLPIVELSWSNGFREIHKPEPPEQPDPGDYELPEEYESEMEDFLQEQKEYEEDLQKYNEKIASGLTRKAFITAGGDRGKVLHFEVITQREGNIPEKGSEIAAQQQIKELQEKDKRNAELAFEKTYLDSKKLLSSNEYSNIERELTPLEWKAVYIVLLDNMGYVPLREEISPKGKGYIENKQKEEIASNLTINQINRLFRAFLQNKLTTSAPNYQISEANSLIQIASECFPDGVKEIELKHQGVYLKRKEKIDSKIEELKQ